MSLYIVAALTGIWGIAIVTFIEALPGGRDPDAWFYVAAGQDCVLLCEHGEAARWRGAVMFTADEARRLGMRLMSIADQAEAEES